ncbi:hypothetical protein HYH02_012402 [Chlamydomonas schloesseri]|uniref:Cytochrome P450 n=1 Tax=Chlamydomonas schloesseri TaxID=2026947 RepID=A0A835TAA6_9CHLO|nr:hypothetical protein HYH02_012402 [Chlamydomonas schloesseri]|eukprot:KAG2434390.1 hypothetical protein HYH02_012402 [Chlamydomonas schloesseri]
MSSTAGFLGAEALLRLALSPQTVAATLAVVLASVVIYLLDPIQRWRLRKIPGPPTKPLLGCLQQLRSLPLPLFLQSCAQTYGPVFKVAMGRKWVVVVANAEMQRQVGLKLRAHAVLDPDFMRGRMHTIIESNLFRASGETWRQLRAAWQPAFAPASLAGYLPLMTACAQQLAARLEAKAAAAAAAAATAGGGSGRSVSGGSVDMWRELGAMTLQVVGSTAYGVDFHAINEEDEQQRDGSNGSSSSSSSRSGGPAAVADDGYGRQLAAACGQVFRYSSAMHGSAYLRVAMLLPELRPLLVPLAHTLPDTNFTLLLQARGRLCNAVFQLIDSWKQQHIGAKGEVGDALHRSNGKADAAGADRDSAAGSARQSSSGAGVGGGGGLPGVAPGSFLDLMLGQRRQQAGSGRGGGGKKADAGGHQEHQEHAPLTDEQVAGQVQLFILAGYETTANALAFAVYCIATHPEAEAALLREVDEVLGGGGPGGGGGGQPLRLPAESDLPRLAYTEAVVNEALRLFPPAHLTSRLVPTTAAGGEPLTVGGYTIPPGTPVFLPMYIAHRDPAVWPRAEEFVPERFLPSAGPLYQSLQPHAGPAAAAGPQQQQHSAHAPFGYGSRMCIGYKFALQEAKVALATLYRTLTFRLEPGQQPIKIEASATMSPRGGLRVTPVLRRQHA